MSVALPDLSNEVVVTPEQRAEFRENGHILLRGIASPEEVAAYRSVITAAVQKLNKETRPFEERDTYAKAFLQIMNIWRDDEGVRKFVFARRFAKIAADLHGVDAIRLYHDQALYKEARGGHTPWHQDQYYWPLDTPHTITMWMPLVDVSEDMGAMVFASGSHKEGYASKIPISDESEAHFDQYVTEQGYPRTSSGAMNAGDATFHAGWTLHSAPANRSDRMREVMTIIYFADGARIVHPDNENRWNDLRTWLPGQKPGELAGTEINPILFAR